MTPTLNVRWKAVSVLVLSSLTACQTPGADDAAGTSDALGGGNDSICSVSDDPDGARFKCGSSTAVAKNGKNGHDGAPGAQGPKGPKGDTGPSNPNVSQIFAIDGAGVELGSVLGVAAGMNGAQTPVISVWDNESQAVAVYMAGSSNVNPVYMVRQPDRLYFDSTDCTGNGYVDRKHPQNLLFPVGGGVVYKIEAITQTAMPASYLDINVSPMQGCKVASPSAVLYSRATLLQSHPPIYPVAPVRFEKR